MQTPAGQVRRLANGSMVTVQSVNAFGQLVLQDGSILRSRQVAYGYALTSHASQGTTVDKVFLAGAASREGLYVAATRGRESVRIFVPDREQFLDAAGLRSEARTSALEFTRHREIQPAFRSHLARAWSYLQQVRAQIGAYLTGHPDAQFLPQPEVHMIPVRAVARTRPHSNAEDYSPSHRHSEAPDQGMRMRL
ncbi:MAG: hypothetical protein PSV13_07515 [Lacunisphaera sp.]|nr:hypothetical protein [Lacunisphaera sp.]